MKFGCSIRFKYLNHGRGKRSQTRWEALDQIAYAEEMGYDSVWFSEHHFRPVWSHNSAPDLTLAAEVNVPQRSAWE
ncbi:MAG: hypothetical protein Ct9H300mP11_32170 [Chloroflexota bacterium]|nr:MAG: hypothetical protein Ct9H300mP11_32170 [Chloroflexota bacterium]